MSRLWIGILLALFALGSMTWSGDEPEPGAIGDAASDAPLMRTAGAGELPQRHAAYGVECTACHGTEPDFATVPTTAQCLVCHGSHEAVADLTAEVVPNPHHSHMGEEACSDCHSEHAESRLSCNQCHVFEMVTP